MNDGCRCRLPHHEPLLVALTGGPCAGKTAVLEVVRQRFCRHVQVLPEAAGIVFGGGFPRRDGEIARRAAQRAIYHVQRELERMALEQRQAAVVLCDRGTVDALAYWVGEPEAFWRDVGSSHAEELARYRLVIHLRTPPAEHGYNNANPVRIETAEQAARIDERILAAWAGHPARVVIDSSPDFVDKLTRALELVRGVVPSCCSAA